MTEIKSTPLKFYTLLPSFKAHVSEEKEQMLPKDIANILENIKNADSYQKYWDIIDSELAKNPKFEKLDDETFKKGEYYIKTSTNFDSEYDKTILNALKEKGISIAPEFIETASSKEGFSLTVLKIKGTKSGDLIDYTKAQHLLSDKEKQEVYTQLQKLTKLGIVNVDILEGNSLKITPDKPHRVISESWRNLCPVEEYTTDSLQKPRLIILEKIHSKLFKN
ncbi:MAG: hypothetical protein KHX03_09205 [Clostridium sp.]|nr:hypothetical protein [Clostridium sp.]